LLRDKKGLSIIIGYVLLVSIAIILSLVVYQFLKTYIPKDSLECTDGVSIFIKEAVYDCENNQLDVTIKNTGRFNIAGYFIHATTSADQELATEDLSEKVSEGGKVYRNSIVFVLGDNFLTPSSPNEKTTTFDLEDFTTIYKIEVIPVRFEDQEGKKRFVSCSGARVEKDLSCYEEPEVCEPNCAGRVCGTDPVCGEICPPNDCGEGYVCAGDGTCILEEDCVDTCASLGYVCGSWVICGVPTTCTPGCAEGESCTPLGLCEANCGNGELDPGEQCDGGSNCIASGETGECTCPEGYISDGDVGCIACNFDTTCDADENCLCSDCENKKDGCNDGYSCQSGECSMATSIDSCKSYCYYLGYDNIASNCALNCGGACEGICEPGGNEYCSKPTIECCCVPYT
jgi:hypothetical protein